jgi:hypothetical protein
VVHAFVAERAVVLVVAAVRIGGAIGVRMMLLLMMAVVLLVSLQGIQARL